MFYSKDVNQNIPGILTGRLSILGPYWYCTRLSRSPIT